VPTNWIYSGTGPVTQHNSEDKPHTVDARSLEGPDRRTLDTQDADFYLGLARAHFKDWKKNVALFSIVDCLIRSRA
jgi:hypothetical protein